MQQQQSRAEVAQLKEALDKECTKNKELQQEKCVNGFHPYGTCVVLLFLFLIFCIFQNCTFGRGMPQRCFNARSCCALLLSCSASRIVKDALYVY